MFEWLECEILEIKTPRFHVVDGPADSRLREAILRSDLSLPRSYKEFVLKFGNAKLYRRNRDGYTIGVFASPRESVPNDGTRIYHLGFDEGASVYVKPVPGSSELPIFEFEKEEEEVALDFEEWLFESCDHARKSYGKERWGEILRGPEPFTPEEERIAETRRRIRWRDIGIDASGDHIFEVTNAAEHTLQVLTVGVRSKDGRLNGAVRLKIGHIPPGHTANVHADCYKDLRSPHEVETIALPDPLPEDREYFAEFRPQG